MRSVLLVIAAFAALVAIGCGGGDDDDSTEATAGVAADTAAAPAAEATAEATATATAAPEATEAVGGDGADGADVAADASALFSGFATAEFMVTFEMETVAAGEDFSGTITWYQDGGERLRFDMALDVGDAVFEATTIVTPDRTLICTEGTCLELSGADGLFPDPSEAFVSQVEDIGDLTAGGSVRDGGARTIAGVEARCFEFDAPEGSGTSCVSPEGVPLFTEFTSPDGDFRLEATAYESSVDDSDFEPPFPVASLGF